MIVIAISRAWPGILRFGARALKWRYEAIYAFESIAYCCHDGGSWWRRGAGLAGKPGGAGGTGRVNETRLLLMR